MTLPNFTFVIGGAASGKSAYAESLCFQSGKSRVYIATAQAFDDEMREKILAHRIQRGADWRTIEAPLDIEEALGQTVSGDIVLLDCVTLWLTNVLLADRNTNDAGDDLLDAISACRAQIVVVSNEVGHGIVPDNALSRQFRAAQGKLNQNLAARAECVVQVIAGLPQALKGTLP